MIAVSVLSATVFSSLSGWPLRMLATRSVCSCTYGSTGFPAELYFHAALPRISPLCVLERPLVPMNDSPTLPARAGDLPAHARHARAVGVLVVNREVIVDVAEPRLLDSRLPSAHADRAHRMALEHPVGDVEVVDVLLDDVIAGEPGEVQPVANLPLAVAPARFLDVAPEGALVPEHLAAHDLANRAARECD